MKVKKWICIQKHYVYVSKVLFNFVKGDEIILKP